MKTLIALLTATTVLISGAQKAYAGDREWATAGKILTGLVIGGAVARALEPPPVYYAPAYAPAVVYAPPPVVAAPPAVVAALTPVYVQAAPAPVVVYPTPVYYAHRAPVYCYAPPVRYYAPRPYVSFSFGFGGRHHGYHHRRGRW